MGWRATTTQDKDQIQRCWILAFARMRDKNKRKKRPGEEAPWDGGGIKEGKGQEKKAAWDDAEVHLFFLLRKMLGIFS